MMWKVLGSVALALFLVQDLSAQIGGDRVQDHYPDGELKAEYFKDADGKRHGRYTEFYKNGLKKITATFDHGVLKSEYNSFYETGKLQARKNYSKGKLVEILRIDPSGVPLFRIAVMGKRVFVYPDLRSRQDAYKRSMEDIRRKLDEIDPPEALAVDKQFEEEPQVREPFQSGKLNTKYIETAVSHLNAYRYLSGVGHDVAQDEGLNDYCQYGAVILAAIGKLSHDPPKVPGMENDFYQKAHKACASSNLHMGSDHLRSSINGYMNDSDDSNIARVGHRAWCLNPRLGKVGFGQSGKFHSMWSFDSSGRGKAPEFIRYPEAGYYPLDYFHPNIAWSMAPQKSAVPKEKDLHVRVFVLKDDYDLDRELSLNYKKIRSGDNGMGRAILFRPVIPKELYGENLKVLATISGGAMKPMAYIIHFFPRKAR